MPSDIRNFFKPYTVPKARVPDNSTLEEEIVVLPTRRTVTPGSSAQKRCPEMASLDGAADDDGDDLMHSSPTRSTQRRMTAVEVPSPKPRVTPEAVPKQPTPAAIPAPAVNPAVPVPVPASASRATTSFSSMSTLSSLPMSSQSSSRRVIKGGLFAVTNSDSGSDSDDELEDLDSFMPRKKLKMTPPGQDTNRAIEIPDTVKPGRQSARLSDKGVVGSGWSTPRLPPSPPRTVYKHSLLSMVKRHEKRQKQDARIADAEAAVAEEDSKYAVQLTAAPLVDGKAKAEAMAEDSDQGARMMQAMARTEAMQDEEHFTFFADAAPRVGNAPFPVHSLPDHSWAHLLKDEPSRVQACLTGFVVDLAETQLLTRDVVRWFACQLAHEPSEELCEAYTAIIQACPEGHDLGWSGLSSLRSFYQTTLGDQYCNATGNQDDGLPHRTSEEMHFSCVCGYAEDDGSAVACDSCGKWQHTTCYHPQYDGKELPEDLEHHCNDCRPQHVDKMAAQRRQEARRAHLSPLRTHVETRTTSLRHVIGAIEHCAMLAGVQQIAHATADFALANIDEHVKGNLTLRTAIADSIEAMLASVAGDDMDRVCSAVMQHLFDDIDIALSLRCQVIAALPATSAHAHQLRRRLALNCITGERGTTSNNRPLASDEWASILLMHFRTAPHFAISEGTDYLLLLQLTNLIDIAIDAGFSPNVAAFFSPTQPTSQLGLKTPAAGSLSEDKKAFNAQIDALTNHIRAMASRIRDAGATHLRRTEAKSALERVAVRLEHSVRTRPKPRKGVFSGGGGGWLGRVGRESNEALIEGFVKQALRQQAPSIQLEDDHGSKEDGLVRMDGLADGEMEVVDDEENGDRGLEVVPMGMSSDRVMSNAEGGHTDDVVSGAERKAQGADAPSPEGQESDTGLWADLKGAVRLR